MKRRELLKRGVALLGAGLWSGSMLGSTPSRLKGTAAEEGQIMTVTGPVAPDDLGPILPHEHVLSRFGAPPARRPDYDLAAVFDTVVPILERIKELGCDAIMDCTAAYFGRDPLIMRRLAEISGLHLVTNTGYYGAADDRYVPDHAYQASPEQLAARWLQEWTDGVEGTGVRPGFVKTAVDSEGFSEIDRKLVRAAALTHRESGLTLAVHTSGNVPAAQEQLRILREEGVSPEAWIWVHAQNVDDLDVLSDAAGQGAWIEFDAIRPDTIERHVALTQAMKQRGHLGRVLLSHDGSSFPTCSLRPSSRLFRRPVSVTMKCAC
jgi:phosphotriesterase-related protein